MEVKQQDEEEESEAGSCSKGGKLHSLKTEEKPVKSEFKKEECSREGGKGVPMDTSTTTPTVGAKTEDRKSEVKVEVKEEEETSEAVTPQAPAKKKSMNTFFPYCISLYIILLWKLSLILQVFLWLFLNTDP